MIEQLAEWDRAAFILINSGLSNSIFDMVLPWLRNKFLWIPLYGAVGVFIWRNPDLPFWPTVMALVASIVIADQLSSTLLKPIFDRARPCHASQALEQLNLLIGCGAGKSFPSSHATNHFAIGTLFGLMFPEKKKVVLVVAMLWAAVISFAQVYVGVHFPLDVLAGAILGILIASIIFLIFRKFVKA